MPRIYITKDPVERMLEHVSMEPMSGCWLWTAALNGKGYGVTRDEYGHIAQAHRLMFRKLRGEIPADKQLDHKCRVRCCLNPCHMEVVTQKENLLRGFGAAAQNARKVVCKRGHSLSGDNLYMQRGTRQCRTCKRLRYLDLG